MQKKLALFKIGSQEYQLSEVDIPGAKCLAEYDDLSEIYPTFYTTSDTYDVSNFASNSAVSAFYATTPTRTVSEAAKRSIGLKNSIHQKGEGNSQFGTRWVHNPKLKQSKKIRSTDDLPPGWIEGRKIKFDED